MTSDVQDLQMFWQEKFCTSDWLTNVISKARSTWWYNPTNPKSLRLTKSVFNAIIQHKSINLYKFELPDAILPKTLVQLERVFTEPYYIFNIRTIYVHSDKDAMMLSLHANNLQQYLDNSS